MTSILEKIKAHKRIEVANAKKEKPLTFYNDEYKALRRNFTQALQKNSPAIIAEIKKASPSKGIIAHNFDVTKIAREYEQNKASSLSVLTDVNFFQGHNDNIMLAKACTNLPVLRKDFIIDEYQIHESLFIGADCILLIVAMLDDSELLSFAQLAHELKLDVLVESHTQEELERALKLPTPLIGINNRSLHTFETSLNLAITLKDYVPKDRIVIAESGINTNHDIKLLEKHGINTFLVGESLMKTPSPGKALARLIGLM